MVAELSYEEWAMWETLQRPSQVGWPYWLGDFDNHPVYALDGDGYYNTKQKQIYIRVKGEWSQVKYQVPAHG